MVGIISLDGRVVKGGTSLNNPYEHPLWAYVSGCPLSIRMVSDCVLHGCYHQKNDGICAMNDHYTYRVFWSEEDQMYVGLCAEYSLLSALADTPGEAFSGIQEVAREAVSILSEDGQLVLEIDDAERAAIKEALAEAAEHGTVEFEAFFRESLGGRD